MHEGLPGGPVCSSQVRGGQGVRSARGILANDDTCFPAFRVTSTLSPACWDLLWGHLPREDFPILLEDT